MYNTVNTQGRNLQDGRTLERTHDMGSCACHMIHLPVGDGQILFWGHGESNPDLGIYTTNNCKVWDFASNTFTSTPNTHNNMFCGSHCQIWTQTLDGVWLIADGHKRTEEGTGLADLLHVFSTPPVWEAISGIMPSPSWYPTSITDHRGWAITCYF